MGGREGGMYGEEEMGKGEGEGGKEEGSGDEEDFNCPHGKCPHLAFALPEPWPGPLAGLWLWAVALAQEMSSTPSSRNTSRI